MSLVFTKGGFNVAQGATCHTNLAPVTSVFNGRFVRRYNKIYIHVLAFQLLMCPYIMQKYTKKAERTRVLCVNNI